MAARLTRVVKVTDYQGVVVYAVETLVREKWELRFNCATPELAITEAKKLASEHEVIWESNRGS